MKKQRAAITIIVLCSLFFMLTGSQLALADGGKIAFCKDIDDRFQIVVTDENGKNMQILSKNHSGDNYEPSWSFNGSRIAFTSNRNGDGFDIYIMNVDGSNEYQVTNNGLWQYTPCFSPNGNKLVFTRTTSLIEGDSKIYTIDIDGRNERYITDGGSARWSSNGEIVFWRDGNIYTMDPDGKNQVKIADNGYSPSWSPDSKQIAFTSHSIGIPGNQIYKMDSNGKNIVCLTNGMTNAVDPSWSPDGKYIAFWEMATYSIYKVSSDGGNSVLISDGICIYPSWFDPAFAVESAGKFTSTWGWIKQK